MLETIEKPADRALICTITGDAGVGKTSLAATFPKPIFIRVEDGLSSIPLDQRPDAFPVIESADDLWEQLRALLKSPHGYKTLVVDSVTALERLFTQAVLELDPGYASGKVKSLNQALGGYGAGSAAVASMHGRLRKAAGLLNIKRGMHVVFIAHADIESLKLPDQDDFQRWSVRLPSKSQAPYVDDVDAVAFVRLHSFLRSESEGDRKRAYSNGDREIVCHATAASVSKNRFGITEPLEFVPGKNPFVGLIPSLSPAKRGRPAKAAAAAETTETNADDDVAADQGE